MKQLNVFDYIIYITTGCFSFIDQIAPLIVEKANKQMVIICDAKLIDLYGVLLQKALCAMGSNSCQLIRYDACESNKTRIQKIFLEDQLLAMNIPRTATLIALGGGITLDMVGFVASTYLRGVSVIYVPTTLLAMVDATMGGKVGVNTDYGKNLIGAFKRPIAVFINLYLLNTLPNTLFADGMSEVIKHALLSDKNFVDWLSNYNLTILRANPLILKECIERSLAIKQKIIIEDEYEQGIRKLLNLGHTFAHGLEKISHYSISHGQAVAWGLVFQAYIAIRLKKAKKKLLDGVVVLLKQYQLLTAIDFMIDRDLLLQAIQYDKKNDQSNVIEFVLLKDFGQPLIDQNRYTVPIEKKTLKTFIPKRLGELIEINNE